MDIEEIKNAVKKHPNLQALSRESGVSAQCLYFIKRGERHAPKESTLRMIERAIKSGYGSKDREKYSERTERLIDLIRTHGVVKSDAGAISSILESSYEINKGDKNDA